MQNTSSFIIQLANFYVEICNYNDEDSAVIQYLKRLFLYHTVNKEVSIDHRIVICPLSQFEISSEATLFWATACIGGAYSERRRRIFFHFMKEVIPQYSGAGEVICYKDKSRQEEYFVPEIAEWRIKHIAQNHVTYVYIDQYEEKHSILPLLLHVIGDQYGSYLIFASCITINGEALLFIGNSGTGKTSLCKELIMQGAGYVGDDLVLLYMKEDIPMVGALLLPMKCFMNGIYNRKELVNIVSEIPKRPPLNTPLKAIYFMNTQNKEHIAPYMEPMPCDKICEHMLELTNKVHTHVNRSHFVDTIASICTSVPSYNLYGNYHKITPSFFF